MGQIEKVLAQVIKYVYATDRMRDDCQKVARKDRDLFIKNAETTSTHMKGHALGTAVIAGIGAACTVGSAFGPANRKSIFDAAAGLSPFGNKALESLSGSRTAILNAKRELHQLGFQKAGQEEANMARNGETMLEKMAAIFNAKGKSN